MGSWHKIAQREFISENRSATLYFFLPHILDRIHTLAKLQNEKVSFLFPVKSFAHPTILSLAAAHLNGFDVSNQFEAELIKPHVLPHHKIWCSSPFSQKIHWPTPVTHDISGSHHLPKNDDSGIFSMRVKPTFLKRDNRFGITPIKAKNYLKQKPQIKSLHVHLSGIENSAQDFEDLIHFYQKFTEDLPPGLNLNFGGGFSAVSLSDMQAIVALAQRSLPLHHLYFEPGRWYLNDAGLGIGKVLCVEENNITTSLSPVCHLRWLNIKHNIYLTSKSNQREAIPTKIFGPTCFENDLIGSMPISPNSVTEDDLVMVDNVSGYSYGWNHSFNGIPCADIIMLGHVS